MGFNGEFFTKWMSSTFQTLPKALKLVRRSGFSIQSLSEMFCEAGHIEDVCRSELLLHLVKLVCAYGVEVFAIELLLQLLSTVEVLHVLADAQEVIFEQAVVLSVI